jgi:hypothetical protein
LVLIWLGSDQDLIQQNNINVRSALKRRVLILGNILQLRTLMESKPYSIAMRQTMWKGNDLSPLLVLLLAEKSVMFDLTEE